jgi:hypothetical protein
MNNVCFERDVCLLLQHLVLNYRVLRSKLLIVLNPPAGGFFKTGLRRRKYRNSWYKLVSCFFIYVFLYQVFLSTCS